MARLVDTVSIGHFLLIYSVICVNCVTAQNNIRALLVYSYESAPVTPTASNLISIEVDSISLNKIIGDSENVAKLAKKINFRDVNGFVKLINGKSSKFSFYENSGNEVCEAQCDVKCKDIITSTATTRVPTFTTTTSRPYTFSTVRSSTGPTYLPPVSITQKDEFVTPPTTQKVTTRKPITTTRKLFTTSQFLSTSRQTVRPSITTRTTARPSITTRTTARSTTRRKSTPGPSYLPISRVTTPRQSSWSTEYYPPATWPKTSKIYTERFPTWSPPPNRSTVTKTISTTPKYYYAEPSNSLAIY